MNAHQARSTVLLLLQSGVTVLALLLTGCDTIPNAFVINSSGQNLTVGLNGASYAIPDQTEAKIPYGGDGKYVTVSVGTNVWTYRKMFSPASWDSFFQIDPDLKIYNRSKSERADVAKQPQGFPVAPIKGPSTE
jgi:hypothetical protein